jgi:hypothetical protein
MLFAIPHLFKFESLKSWHESTISQIAQDARGRYRGCAIHPRSERQIFFTHSGTVKNIYPELIELKL